MFFKPHGKYSARIINDHILFCTISNPWNLEMLREMLHVSSPLVKELDRKGSWICVVHIDNSLTTCVNVLEAIRNLISQKRGLDNMLAVAWAINPSVEGYCILRYKYEQVFEGLLPYTIVDTVEDAVRWSEKRLTTTKNDIHLAVA